MNVFRNASLPGGSASFDPSVLGSVTQDSELTTLPVSSIHHVSYAVTDLERGIHDAVATLGAGPFFVSRDVPLEAMSNGERVEFRHSAAFGQWGGVVMELMEIEDYGSARIEAAIGQQRPVLSHVAWAVPSLNATVTTLNHSGLPAFLRARIGEIEFSWHDARGLYGHHLEVHANSAGFRRFFQQVREASIGWDGDEPIREFNDQGDANVIQRRGD